MYVETITCMSRQSLVCRDKYSLIFYSYAKKTDDQYFELILDSHSFILYAEAVKATPTDTHSLAEKLEGELRPVAFSDAHSHWLYLPWKVLVDSLNPLDRHLCDSLTPPPYPPSFV